MGIVGTDIVRRYSGGSGNTDPNASLGGQISSTSIANNTLNALFSDFSGQESNDGVTKYRCFYILNNHGSLTAKNPKIYFTAQPANSGVTVALAAGSSAVNGTEQTIADENTAPTGVSFTTPTSGSKLSLSDIPAGQWKAIWVRLVTASAATAKDADSYTLAIDVDTNE